MQAKELAEILGITPATISGWKTSKSKPSVDNLMTIAEKFEVSLDWLLLGKEALSPIQEYSTEALEVAALWDKLDDAGKTIVKAKAIEELRRLEK